MFRWEWSISSEKVVTLSPYVSETNIIFSIKSHRGISDHILDIQVPGITGIEFAQSIQYGFWLYYRLSLEHPYVKFWSYFIKKGILQKKKEGT